MREKCRGLEVGARDGSRSRRKELGWRVWQGGYRKRASSYLGSGMYH
jgi:hypothetical protein